MKVRHVDWSAADWLEGTVELSYEEEGCYADIVNLIYARGGPITRELIYARGKGRRDYVDRIVQKLISRRKVVDLGEFLSTSRCDLELNRARSKLVSSSLAASKRWNNKAVENATASSHAYAQTLTVASENHDASSSDSLLRQTVESLPESSELVGENPPHRAPIRARESVVLQKTSVIEEKFAEFWKQYPVRNPHPNPRKPAFEKFKTKLKTGVDPERMIQGASLFAGQCAAANGDPKFIPTAVVWLNREGWEDAIATGELPSADEPFWQRQERSERITWRGRVKRFLENGSWDDVEWGQKPGVGGENKYGYLCECPQEILKEFDFPKPNGVYNDEPELFSES